MRSIDLTSASSRPGRPLRSSRRRAVLVALAALGAIVLVVPLPSASAAGTVGDLSTFAGNGDGTPSGDAGPAVEAGINAPIDVAFDADGNAYIAARNEGDVRKVTPDGTISTLVSGFQTTSAIAFDPVSNSLFVASENDRAVFKVTLAGVKTTFAGTGTEGYNGDGIDASTAQLNFPRGVAVDGDGNVFIADTDNNRVREVTADGKIHTVAGTGTGASTGDGGAAAAAGIDGPWSLDVDDAGVVYEADRDCRVRAFTVGGAISAFAGSGSCSSGGDGGPAVDAGFGGLAGLAVRSDGTVFIGEFGHRTRQVAPDGTITTVAGTGTIGFSGDGGPATAAELNFPKGIALGPDGNLFIADYGNNRVRVLQLAPVVPATTTTTTVMPTTVPTAPTATPVAATASLTG